MYLTFRGYKPYSNNDNKSTVFWYSNAISDISRLENLSFKGVEDNIDRLVVEYGQGGEKRHLGEKGNKTWINALGRLKEFVSYQKEYMK